MQPYEVCKQKHNNISLKHNNISFNVFLITFNAHIYTNTHAHDIEAVKRGCAPVVQCTMEFDRVSKF